MQNNGLQKTQYDETLRFFKKAECAYNKAQKDAERILKKPYNDLEKAERKLILELKTDMKYCQTAEEFIEMVSKLPNRIKEEYSKNIVHYTLVMKIHDILGRRKLSLVSMVGATPTIKAMIEKTIEENINNSIYGQRHAKKRQSEKITFMLIWMYRYGWVNRDDSGIVEAITIRKDPSHLITPLDLILQNPCGPVGYIKTGYCLFCCSPSLYDPDYLENFISSSKALMR